MNSQCIHLHKTLVTILSQDNKTTIIPSRYIHLQKKKKYIYIHIQNHSRRCVRYVQFEFTRDNLSI